MSYPRRPDRPCEWCAADFHGGDAQQRFCSKQCFADFRSHAARTRTEKRCPGCGITKPIDAFAKAYQRADGRQTWCKACGVLACHPTQRAADLMKKYGLTLGRFDAMLAEQEGCCAICRTDDPGGQFHVDHDRACCPSYKSCGKCVRGLLCHLCNKGLGMFRDSVLALQSAVVYLTERSPSMNTDSDYALKLGLIDSIR